MRNDMLTLWQRVEDVLQPEAITRIGLRYINHIPKEAEQDGPGGWLKENDYISKGLLRSSQGFLLRLETRLDRENVLIITLGDTRSEGDEAIVFDIDRVVEREIGPEQGILEQEMNRLHAAVWEVFSSAQGEKLEELLNRRPE
jgi:uncharacterized protein (TIGR04255 family)